MITDNKDKTEYLEKRFSQDPFIYIGTPENITNNEILVCRKGGWLCLSSVWINEWIRTHNGKFVYPLIYS